MSDQTNEPLATQSGKQLSDMNRLMATGARLLREKTEEHIAAVSAYEKARVELADSYRVQIEQLRVDAENHLRQFDIEHANNIASIEALINKLKTLRDA